MFLRRIKLYVKFMYVLVIIFIGCTLFSIYKSNWVWVFIGFLGVLSTLYEVKQIKKVHDMLAEALDNVSDEQHI